MKTFYLILLVLFPSIMFGSSASSAEYVFVVENTAMVDAYYNIFNALASIFQSESYMDLLKLAFLFGGFLMLTKGVFATYEGSANAKMISDYGKYLATVVGLLVIISGKSTVWVTTNNIPTFCSTSSPTVGTAVDNIPSILAYSFSVANTIGNGLTEIAEAGFTKATESTMTKSDGYLGNLKQTIKVLTLDPSKTSVENDFDFTNMWSVFFSDCVYMPSINQGQEGSKILSDAYKTKDLLFFSETLMNYTFTDGAGLSPIGDSIVKYMGQSYTCSAFLATIKSLTETHLSNYSCTLPLANSGVLELITGNVNTGATGASEMNGIARQAGLINAFKGSKAINSIGIQGADSFTGGTTKASFNMNSLSSASYMADMMPYVQMTLRAVLYAFFPFIFVVIILPGGLKVLSQYAKTLIWIELWTPTAAILHMFVSIHAQDKLSGMYNNSTGITLMNSIDMLSETATLAGVGAMLYVSVPAITWLMITGSGQMLGNVMSGVSASFGSQLAKDQSGMELAKDLQRQKMNQKIASDSDGKQAALSYGEMMFYENLHKGHQDAGTFASNQNIMKSGGELYDKTFVENQSRYFDAMTKKEELKTLGVTDKNGNIDYNKLKEVSQKKGDTAGADAARTMEKYDFNGDKKVSNEEIQQAMTQGTKADQLKTQEELKKAMGTIAQIGGGSIQTASDVNSKTAVNDQDLKNKTQQKVLEEETIDSSSTSKAKKEVADINSNEELTQDELNEEAKKNAEYNNSKTLSTFDGNNQKEMGKIDGTQAKIDNKIKGNVQKTINPNEQIKAGTDQKLTEIKTTLNELSAGNNFEKKAEAKAEKTAEDVGRIQKLKERFKDLNPSQIGELIGNNTGLSDAGKAKAEKLARDTIGDDLVEDLKMGNHLISMGGVAAGIGAGMISAVNDKWKAKNEMKNLETEKNNLNKIVEEGDKSKSRMTDLDKEMKDLENSKANAKNPGEKREIDKKINDLHEEKKDLNKNISSGNSAEKRSMKLEEDLRKASSDFKKANGKAAIYGAGAAAISTMVAVGAYGYDATKEKVLETVQKGEKMLDDGISELKEYNKKDFGEKVDDVVNLATTVTQKSLGVLSPTSLGADEDLKNYKFSNKSAEERLKEAGLIKANINEEDFEKALKK